MFPSMEYLLQLSISIDGTYIYIYIYFHQWNNLISLSKISGYIYIYIYIHRWRFHLLRNISIDGISNLTQQIFHRGKLSISLDYLALEMFPSMEFLIPTPQAFHRWKISRHFCGVTSKQWATVRDFGKQITLVP